MSCFIIGRHYVHMVVFCVCLLRDSPFSEERDFVSSFLCSLAFHYDLDRTACSHSTSTLGFRFVIYASAFAVLSCVFVGISSGAGGFCFPNLSERHVKTSRFTY